MRNKICLWSGPRNISTALMYSFNSRLDTIVFDEPLYAHYLNYSRVKHPGYKEILDTYNTDGNQVVNDVILRKYDRCISFFKLMSHFSIGLNLSFLKKVQNILLLRNPLDVISSYNQVIQNPTINDIGILYQYNLFNYFNENNIEYVVVTAEDILQNPKQMLMRLCDKLNIDFTDKMLKWEKGPKDIDGIWGKYWYSGVHKTDRFVLNKKKIINLSKKNILLYHDSLKYYNLLIKYKI